MTVFPYMLQDDPAPNIGLVVLQSDQRIEQDFRRLLPLDVNLYVSRLPSSPDVTAQTLQAMEAHIPTAAGLLPRSVRFDAIGYGCTSGTAQIGQARVGELLRAGVSATAASEPLSALVTACRALGIERLGFLSPYIPDVSNHLRRALEEHGILSPVFGSFAEAEEEKVARISQDSLICAARTLAGKGEIDALFLSCTNLNTLGIIETLERSTGVPVLSSNLVLGWHMCSLAGVSPVGEVGRSRLAQCDFRNIG
jgi:maleate isomerase